MSSDTIFLFGIAFLFTVFTSNPFEVLVAATVWMIGQRSSPIVHIGWGKKMFTFKLGRMTIKLHPNLFRWNASTYRNYNGDMATLSGKRGLQIIIIVISVTVLAYGIIIVTTFIWDMHPVGNILQMAASLRIGTILVNLVYYRKPKVGDDGQETNYFGAMLTYYYKLKNFPDPYERARQYYYQKNYKEAVPLLEAVMDKGVKDLQVFRLMINAYIQMGDLNKAYQTNLLLELTGKQLPYDSFNAGWIKDKLGLYEESIQDYTTAINRAPRYSEAYNNRGYSYLHTQSYRSALQDFDHAISLAPDDSHSYNNRGLTKMRLGIMDEGLADIEHALKLDPDNAYAYRNMGIYFYERGEFRAALPLFERAKKLDSSVVDIDMYLSWTTQKLNPEL